METSDIVSIISNLQDTPKHWANWTFAIHKQSVVLTYYQNASIWHRKFQTSFLQILLTIWKYVFNSWIINKIFKQ